MHCFLEISILESWHVRCSNGFKRRDIWVPNTFPRTWPRYQEYSKSLKNAYSSKFTIEDNFSTSTYSWIQYCNINQNIAAPLLDIVWFFACVYCSNNDYILQMKMEAIQGPTVCSSSQMLTSRLWGFQEVIGRFICVLHAPKAPHKLDISYMYVVLS